MLRLLEQNISVMQIELKEAFKNKDHTKVLACTKHLEEAVKVYKNVGETLKRDQQRR